MGNHDVFISYSTKNKNVADAVVADFEQHGIKCWYAPRDILPGEEWVTAITKALEVSKALVLIFTDESNNSRQVMNEIAVAFNAGITIVPFRLTDEQMSSELEYYLTRVHWLDAVSKPLKKNITALREYIEVIVNTENGAAPEKPLTEEQTEAVKKAKKREKMLSCLFLVGVLCVVLGVVVEGVNISKKNAKAKEFQNAVEMYYGQADVSDSETLKSVLEDVQIPQISKSEQELCMKTMDLLESIIRERQSQLTHLDELIKARFVEMFGDTESNPYGWKKQELKDHADVITGYAFPSEGYSEAGFYSVG